MADPRKEIHLSLTVGPLNDPHSANLTIDWTGGVNDIPTGSWRRKQGAATADTNKEFTIESGFSGQRRFLTIPAWGVGQPNDHEGFKVHWRDQFPQERQGVLIIP